MAGIDKQRPRNRISSETYWRGQLLAGRGPVGSITGLEALSGYGVWGRDDVAMRRAIAITERKCVW